MLKIDEARVHNPATPPRPALSEYYRNQSAFWSNLAYFTRRVLSPVELEARRYLLVFYTSTYILHTHIRTYKPTLILSQIYCDYIGIIFNVTFCQNTD